MVTGFAPTSISTQRSGCACTATAQASPKATSKRPVPASVITTGLVHFAGSPLSAGPSNRRTRTWTEAFTGFPAPSKSVPEYVNGLVAGTPVALARPA